MPKAKSLLGSFIMSLAFYLAFIDKLLEVTCCENPQKNWYKNCGKMKQRFQENKRQMVSRETLDFSLNASSFSCYQTLVSDITTSDKVGHLFNQAQNQSSEQLLSAGDTRRMLTLPRNHCFQWTGTWQTQPVPGKGNRTTEYPTFFFPVYYFSLLPKKGIG